MITIIDYGVGNLGSICTMLDRIGQRYEIGLSSSDILTADALLLPGVGAAGVGMENLKENGLDNAIKRSIADSTPFLGICLGMQILFDSSEENVTECLGIVPGTVKKFTVERKVPQIGWNEVIPNVKNPYSKKLFNGISDGSAFYYVNSYFPEPKNSRLCAATSVYGETFTAVIATESIVATQFHPEKSGEVGLQFIKNFMKEYV